MLSKKRQILFEVLGQRTRPSRSPERPPEPEAPLSRTTPRQRTAQRSQSKPVQRPGALWLGLSAVVLVSVLFVLYRIRRPGNAQTPALQTNTSEQRPPAGTDAGEPARQPFSIVAWERTYKNKTERKLAADRVQEIVDFLGYHADPDFRDVRGKDHVGKEPNTGTYRIYVGSATRRTELFPLRDKLTALAWKGGRPFKDASIPLNERAATPGSKEVSDER